MPHERSRQRARASDERLRRDREETDRSLSRERESVDELLLELERALRLLHEENPAPEEDVGLEHGQEPWKEEMLKHGPGQIQQIERRRRKRRSGEGREQGRRGKIKALERKFARERYQSDQDLRQERARMERLLTRAVALASTDSLTDLVNARVFVEILEGQITLCESEEQSFGLMYVDLDNFKRVNDIFGHVEGDVLLRQISSLLRRDVRREDVAARLGGDEFGILVAGLPPEKVEDIARRIITSIQELNADYPGASLGASLGLLYVNCSRPLRVDANELLRRADAAMYEAKASGKQTVMITLPPEG